MKLPKVDEYFLTRDAPVGKYRRLDTIKIRNWLLGIGAVALIAVLFTGNAEPEPPPAATTVDSNTSVSQGMSQSSAAYSGDGNFYLSNVSGHSLGGRVGAGRQLTASQVVKPQGNSIGVGLPSGTTIPARLANRIVTSDSRGPVVAIITSEISSQLGFAIPVGTKALGNAQTEHGSERVQVTFHTLVFENGSEQPFSAVAVMPDGSNGIVGEYHSQIFKRESGRFLGHFISGFADGFKDRERGNGAPFEPGNLKNAALNGLSESASEHAKNQAEEMKNVTPYVTVEPGTPFLVFLEKGMSL